MTTPNRSELTFYTNRPLYAQDWEDNWLKVIAWLTDGDYDFTINNLTLQDLSVLGSLVFTGDISVGVVTCTDLVCTTNDITCDLGNIVCSVGDITATAGDIVATAGNITATVGDITATAGDVNCNNVFYNSAKTKYLAILPCDFQIELNDLAYPGYYGVNLGWPIHMGSTTTPPSYTHWHASVKLPTDAIITRVDWWYYRTDAVTICEMKLRRIDYDTTGTGSDMCTLTASSTSGDSTMNTTSIDYATINNGDFMYFLYLRIYTNIDVDDVKSGCVRITYTIIQP